jgi:glycosyltransferase involved in cell wall biosynthesis
MEKKTVLLKGPLCSKSGYGEHSRQIARWLFANAEKLNLEIATELLHWGQTPWHVDAYAQDGLIGELLQAESKKKPFYDIAISVQLPNEWSPTLAKYNIGVTAGLETDRCQPAWIDCINRMNLVVTPSEFTKQCFVNTAKLSGKKLMTDIVVVPESFPDALLEKDVPELPLDLKTDFNFLVFGQLTGNNPENDRKNLFYTFKWLAEAFAGNPNIGVIFKTNAGRQTKLDKAVVKNLFHKLMFESNVNPVGPKFHLLHGDMTDEELAGLYRHPKIKALVSLSRGEGFNLTALEAAASGLPIIATDWSAPLEYLNLGKFIKVEANIAPVHPSRVDTLFPKDAQWAHPKEQDAKLRLVKFSMNSSMPKQWANDLKPKIIENYSFSAISKKYDTLFERVLSECF